MIMTLTPAEAYLLTARATIGAGESPPNTNGGPFVNRVQRRTGNKTGDAWCMSYALDLLALALGEALFHAAAIPRSGRVQDISDWAANTRCRYTPAAGAQPGDWILVHYPKLKRHAHVRIVEAVTAPGVYTTIEGNTTLPGDTNPETQREGWIVARKTGVTLGPKDRIVRWVERLPALPSP